LIKTNNLSKTFPAGLRAVDSLSLDIAAGEIYGLVGPDGAGKTTTLRLLCRALEPDTALDATSHPAVVEIAGFDLLRETEKVREQIGYLPQRFSLYEDLTVLENIRFFAEVRGIPAAQWRARCDEILAFVGLDAFTARRAGQLSGGMKQKLGLAAALVHQPRVLLLDEPTTGVDPVTRQDFWQLIIRLAGGSPAGGGLASDRAERAIERVTVLISTPYMDEASRCTRVGLMRQGRILTEGSPAELCRPLEGLILEVAGKPLPAIRLALQQVDTAQAGIRDVQMFGDRIHCRVPAGAAGEVKAYLEDWLPAQGFQLARVRSIAPQLEDVFISIMEETQ